MHQTVRTMPGTQMPNRGSPRPTALKKKRLLDVNTAQGRRAEDSPYGEQRLNVHGGGFLTSGHLRRKVVTPLPPPQTWLPVDGLWDSRLLGMSFLRASFSRAHIPGSHFLAETAHVANRETEPAERPRRLAPCGPAGKGSIRGSCSHLPAGPS